MLIFREKITPILKFQTKLSGILSDFGILRFINKFMAKIQ
jgi:hypothetical protein